MPRRFSILAKSRMSVPPHSFIATRTAFRSSALRTNGTAADVVVITAPGTTEEGVYGRVLTLAYPYSGVATTAASELRLNEEGTIAVSPPAS